jgi:hypothetical protein
MDPRIEAGGWEIQPGMVIEPLTGSEPTLSQIHVDKALQNMTVAAMGEGFPALGLFGEVTVVHESDNYHKYDFGDTRRAEADEIPDAGVASEIGYGISQGTYALDERGLKIMVSDRVIRNADSPLSPLQDGARIVANQLTRSRAKAISDYATTTGNYTNSETLAGADQWSDQNSSPLEAIRAKAADIEVDVGRWPETFAIGRTTMLDLIKHQDIRDVIGTGNGAPIAAMMNALAEQIMVREVIVMSETYTTSNRGQTDAFARIWGDDAALLVKDPNPTLMSVQFGSWMIQRGQKFAVRRWRSEERRAWVVEVRITDGIEQIHAGAGYLWKDTN